LKSPARQRADAPARSIPASSSVRFLAPLALALLAVAAYSNSFTTGFPLDNKGLILQDQRVHAATAANVELILGHTYWWPIGESGLYRPVTTLSYLFNYAILGNADRPIGYHVVNLALHVANVLLLFALLCQFLIPNPKFPITPLAFAPAALWAVHPLATEAVTNIVGRADLIAACAVLAGLMLFVRSSEATGAKRAVALAGLSVATLIGVFAKETAVVVVPLLVLMAACRPEPQIESGPKRSKRGHERRALRDLTLALIAVAPPLLVLWMQRVSVLGAAPAAEFPFVDNPIVAAGFWSGRATALAVMLRYVWLFVWPLRLSADYSYAHITVVDGGPWMWAAVASVPVVAGALALLWRLNRAAFFFAAFSLTTFLPASNLLFPAGTIMAERVMYLPSAGLAALVAILIAPLSAHATPRRALAASICVLVAGFGARTWLRNRDWRDDVSLWTSASRVVPRSFKVHRGLAEALYESDSTHANIARVVAEDELAVGVLDSLPDPLNDAKTYRQAGADYIERGDGLRTLIIDPAPSPADIRAAYERAVALLTRCVKIVEAARGPAKPMVAADAYRLLSAAYVRLEQPDRAVETATRAQTLDPQNVVGYRQAAAAFLTAKRNDDAAIVLMTGAMVTDDRSLSRELLDLYQRGLDPLRCAVTSTPQGPAINPACETVRRHACAATPEAVRIHERAGRADQAARLREGAARQFRCSQG